MTPDWWDFILLAAAVFRLWRLAAADTLPWIVHARDRLVGAEWIDGELKSLRHPALAKFIECPWCLGFWIGVAWWAAWLWEPNAALVVATPFALSAAVGALGHHLGE